jgi:hypothetical protein
MSRYLFSLFFILLALGRLPVAVCARETLFPVPAGLQGAVDFWKQVFTRRSFGEVILFDPADLGTTYSVLRVPDSEQGRALVSKERARITVSYDLAEEETRIRSQRGAKEQFSEGLRISGRYITKDEVGSGQRFDGAPVVESCGPLSPGFPFKFSIDQFSGGAFLCHQLS